MAPIFTAHPFSIAEMPAIDCVHHRFILRFQIQEVCPRILLSPRLEFSVPNYQVLFIAKVNNHINSLVESIQMARRFVVQLGPYCIRRTERRGKYLYFFGGRGGQNENFSVVRGAGISFRQALFVDCGHARWCCHGMTDSIYRVRI